MKEILEELKGSMGGVIGSFVINGKGDVAANDMPELMGGVINKVSKTMHHVTSVIKATRSVDKITVDSDSAKLISIPTDGKILVVLAEKNINQPLFKLMSNMAVQKVKESPEVSIAPKEPEFNVDKIANHYDLLYGAAAKRLANIIGPKSGQIFNEGSDHVKNSYPKLLSGIIFGRDGKPDIEKIKENAAQIPKKDELLEGLDELLLSMLDSVKKTAGAKQEQKAMDEIQKIKSSEGEI
jgi:predicted regulator of Ras-like GTPase activity (Roadblock/LC7/MglB family)